MNRFFGIKVLKSQTLFVVILLFCSCGSKEQKLFNHNKVETPLTNDKDKSNEKSVENVSSKDVVSIESKIEKEKIVKPKLLSKKKDQIECLEISDTSKSSNQIKTESIPFKYSGHPFAGRGGTNSNKEPGRDHGNGSAKCYGSELRFYDKDTLSIKRYYISIPNTSNIKNEEFCKISFKTSVDANGDIISVRVNSYGTTTTNQELINQVRDIVKSQLKYNKVDPNTPVFSDNITIVIQPN